MSLPFNTLPYPRVIIVGGGFAGLELAKKLSHRNFKVFLLDKNNYHTFQPLLYQVATGGLGSDAIAYPLRKVIGPLPNVAFRMASVMEINPSAKEVHTDVGIFHYDYLVLATGSTTNFFGNKEFESFTMPLKNVPDALNIRSLWLQEFEKALVHQSTEVKQQALNFVIVGGGPTGVELAGALSEIKKTVMPADYRELDPKLMTIHLIEAGSRLLSAMSEKSSRDSLNMLQKMGVAVKLNTAVKSYDGQELELSDGSRLKTDTVIWSAGVKGNPVKGFSPELITKSGRLVVDEYNRVKGFDDIFAIGDIASMISGEYPNGHPMVAPVAQQQGKHLGDNLIRLSQAKKIEPFVYRDKGSMATVGRNKAVVDLSLLHFKGWFAWIVWMLVHLLMLVGFRSKVITLMNWIWNYFSYERAIRLIVRPFRRREVG